RSGWAGWSPVGYCVRYAPSPQRYAGSPRRTCTSASSSLAPTTNSPNSATPSTGCSPGWTRPSTRSAASLPTPHTSCGPRWPANATVGEAAGPDPEAPTESPRAAHERVLAAGAQQERIIESLLPLARGQAGLHRHDGFDLAGLAKQVLAARGVEAAARD